MVNEVVKTVETGHKMMIVIAYIAVFLSFFVIIGDFIKSEPEPKAGYFITMENLEMSFYITRLVESHESDSGKEGICIIQTQFPSGFFENCVVKEAVLDWMETYDGKITKEAKYTYDR